MTVTEPQATGALSLHWHRLLLAVPVAFGFATARMRLAQRRCGCVFLPYTVRRTLE